MIDYSGETDRIKMDSDGSLCSSADVHIGILKSISVTLLCLILGACNGGILGTGDGDDPKLVPELEGNDIQEGPDPIQGVTDPGIDNNLPDDSDISFLNNQTTSLGGTAGDTALIRVVHAATDERDENLVITDQATPTLPFIDLPGLSYVDSDTGYRSVNASVEHDFDIYRSEEFRANNLSKLAGINPLVVSNNTASTIILRGTSNSATPFEVLVLANHTATNNDNGYLRVVHAAGYFAARGALDIHLLSAGETLDPGLPTFNNALVYADNPATTAIEPDSGYIEVVPGTYTFTGTAVGSASAVITQSAPFQLSRGQVLTLVIRDDVSVTPGVSTALLLIDDSDLN